jgi:hypothetical protein
MRRSGSSARLDDDRRRGYVGLTKWAAEVGATLDAVLSEPTNWSRRYKQNVELLKSGSLASVAIVVERLEIQDRDKGLSRGERRMLQRARGILATEVFLGLPDGWDGDDGTAGVREPRGPDSDPDSGSEAVEVPEDPQ